MAISTPTLYLNTGTLQTADASPFIRGLTDPGPAEPWGRVSGATGPLAVVLCTVAGDVVSRASLASGNTLHFIAKADPEDADLAIEIDFTASGASGSEVYTASEANLSIDPDLWGKPKMDLVGNFEERNSGGDVLRIWNATLALTRGVGDGGSPSPQIYVKTRPQSLESGEKTQALNNLGGSTSGKAVFQGTPAEGRAALEITGSGDVVSDGTITSANAGKIAVVTNLKTIGSGVAYSDSATASTVASRDSSGNLSAVGFSTGVEGVARAFVGGVSLIGYSSLDSVTWVINNSTGSAEFSTVTVSGGVTADTGTFTGGVYADTFAAYNGNQGFVLGASSWYGYTTGDVTTWTLDNATGNATSSGSTVWTNSGNTVTISGLGIVGNDGTDDVFELDVVNGTLSAGSGAFSVSANGDMAATHGKFMGSAGQAGHVQLKQGTTPNGTANETTLWGIAGGIGWRNGTGTAYALTLPTASGTLALTSDIPALATTAQEVAGTLATVATTPASGHVKQIYQAYRTAFSSASFSQAVSGTGASTGTTDWGVDVTGPTTAVGYGIRRNAPTNSFAASRGKGRGVIAWGRRVELVGTACIYAGLDANAVFRVTFGKTSGANAGNLSARGLGFRVQGTGALEIETHNGTTRTASTNSTFTPTINQAFDFRITSDGAGNCVLWVNDTQVATCTGGPTTDSSSTENALQVEIENVSTVTTQSSATAGNFGVYLARS